MLTNTALAPSIEYSTDIVTNYQNRGQWDLFTLLHTHMILSYFVGSTSCCLYPKSPSQCLADQGNLGSIKYYLLISHNKLLGRLLYLENLPIFVWSLTKCQLSSLNSLWEEQHSFWSKNYGMSLSKPYQNPQNLIELLYTFDFSHRCKAWFKAIFIAERICKGQYD